MCYNSDMKRVDTKTKIINAFMFLLRKENISDVNISQICEEAGVPRVTFYRNFGSIDGLINEIVNRLYGYVIKNCMDLFVANDREAWSEAIDFLLNDIENENGKIFRMSLSNLMVFNARFIAKANANISKDLTGVKDTYNPVLNICIVLICIRKYIAGGCKEDKNELKEYILSKVLA